MYQEARYRTAAEGFRVLYRETQHKRKRVVEDALGPSMTIAPSRERGLTDSARSISKCKRSESVFHHSLSFVLGLPIQNTEALLHCRPVSGLLIHDGSSTTLLYWVSQST